MYISLTQYVTTNNHFNQDLKKKLKGLSIKHAMNNLRALKHEIKSVRRNHIKYDVHHVPLHV